MRRYPRVSPEAFDRTVSGAGGWPIQPFLKLFVDDIRYYRYNAFTSNNLRIEENLKIVVVGGGAAGVFSALAALAENPQADVVLLEKAAQLLSKVRISGGGRCNATHACFDPKELVKHYPRGSKELLGPFHRFQPLDTIDWFESRGVFLKKEPDGRMFPKSDSSQTIVDCFFQEADRLKLDIRKRSKVLGITKSAKGFEINIGGEAPLHADRLVLATGSARMGWEVASFLGHTIQAPVPSLFTLNIASFPFAHLAGVSVDTVKLSVNNKSIEQTGPLLMTHWGFSGPAALKLSAWAARFLAEKSYQAALRVDWIPNYSFEKAAGMIKDVGSSRPTKKIGGLQLFPLPKSLWRELCKRCHVPDDRPLCQLSRENLAALCRTLKDDRYEIHGKTTNKEEFVTCGGVTLSEVQFKTMESKICPGLFFCGEILDIDGITGGFNFQSAWTTGWTAGRAAAPFSL